MPWSPKKRRSAWDVIDDRRRTSAERGYDSHWSDLSSAYRREHPLCVHCQLRERLAPSECVDHIIPIACCPELRLDPDNWQALCWSCHSYKTTKEPRYPWRVDRSRLVLCGLPGTGKSTLAKEIGAPYFDADELALRGVDAIVKARDQWISERSRGPITVIVASGITASMVAAKIRGRVQHLTTMHRAA